MADDWLKRAACRGMHPSQFHPTKRQVRERHAALAICAGCPVRQECLDDALEYERHADFGAFGIRGGLTAVERQVMLGRRNSYRTKHSGPLDNPAPIKHGTHGGYIAHIRQGVPVCADCRWAAQQYRRQYRAAKRARRLAAAS